MKGQEKNASVVLVLVDVNEQNIQCIMEVATEAHFDEIILCGSTPIPENMDHYHGKWQYCEDAVHAAVGLNCQGYEVVTGTLTDDSELITEVEFTSRKIAVFVGHISEALLKESSRSIHHPLHLQCRSPSASILVGAMIHDIFCRREAAAKSRLMKSAVDYRDSFPITTPRENQQKYGVFH